MDEDEYSDPSRRVIIPADRITSIEELTRESKEHPNTCDVYLLASDRDVSYQCGVTGPSIYRVKASIEELHDALLT
jgi:hypothetical protein